MKDYLAEAAWAGTDEEEERRKLEDLEVGLSMVFL